MADKNKISLIGELDKTATKKQLNKDLKALSGSIDNLKLKAVIDEHQIRELENLISHLKSLTGKLLIDKSAVNNCINSINSTINGINITINSINTGNIDRQAKQIGREIGQSISENTEKEINHIISSITDSISRTRKSLSNLQKSSTLVTESRKSDKTSAASVSGTAYVTPLVNGFVDSEAIVTVTNTFGNLLNVIRQSSDSLSSFERIALELGAAGTVGIASFVKNFA